MTIYTPSEAEAVLRRVLEEAQVGVAMLDALPDNQPAGMSEHARAAYIGARMDIYLRNILTADALVAAASARNEAKGE